MRFQVSKELDEILRKLDRNLREQVFKKIEKILSHPELGKPLSNELASYRSERVGKFRLIYRTESDLIIFHTSEHRKKAYGR